MADTLPAHTDQRIASILWHIEDAVRGTMPDTSGSMLAVVRFEALSCILFGVLGCIAIWVFRRWLTGAVKDSKWSWVGSGVALSVGVLFAWLALNPLNWAIVLDPQIGIAQLIIQSISSIRS